MREVVFRQKDFFSNYFWSMKDGAKIREDVLVKTYLQNYFAFKDIVSLYRLVGKKALLQYAKELGMYERVKKLVDLIDAYMQTKTVFQCGTFVQG